MVGSQDFLIYGYAQGEFLSPDLFFNASFNVQYSCSWFIYADVSFWGKMLCSTLSLASAPQRKTDKSSLAKQNYIRCTIFHYKTLATVY